MAKLKSDGVVAFRWQGAKIIELNGALECYIDKLLYHKKNTPPEKRKFRDKVMLLPREDKNLYVEARKLLDKYGILDIASAYRNRHMQMTDLFLQISDPDDMDWKDHFKDAGVPDPKTAYMHCDSSVGWMKCLVYLNDVSLENGPFRYVVGSNRFKINFPEYITRRANDKSYLDKCDPKNRELFSALPKIFQKKAEFGNDLMDGSQGSKMLMSLERSFISADGNLLFFDTDGIHRGGMVEKGQRRILQIVLEPVKN